jgi:phage-related protein (TIGR01555 family)
VSLVADTEKTTTDRADGYVNVLNKYGTTSDNSTAYQYESGGSVPDSILTTHYEQDGLFSKIIDAPAEEAIKHGFELDGELPDAEELLNNTLDILDWEQKAATAVKWARLYGGAIIVMLINDGGGLDEPLNRKLIRGIDGIRVYERAIVQPDWTAALYGEPQSYNVSSISGYFTVHASRCLVFKNGVLPEHMMNAQYRFWGLPEYLRIKSELRECATAHGHGVKLLERSVQAIYSMDGLANLVTTESGEDEILKRLQVIDKARGILNSIAIDADKESYEFKTIPFSGVKDIIDTTCNMLSAVTNIPQTVLFGRSPAGMSATGQSDLENYYNLIERIQRIMLYGNLKTLTDVIFRAALATGDLDEKPTAKIKFKPLWSLSETEQATVEQSRATTSQTKAQTAQIYVDMGALDPSEVRAALAADNEFEIEKMLDNLPEEDLFAAWDEPTEPQTADTPEADEPPPPPQLPKTDAKDTAASVGVLVLNNTGESVLCGTRTDNRLICGSGGHIQAGETPAQAAIRETQEEFGITPLNLKRIGQITGFEGDKYGEPIIYLCTEYEGEPKSSKEIRKPCFFPIDEFEPEEINLFPPFAESLNFLGNVSKTPLTFSDESVIMANADADDQPRDNVGKFGNTTGGSGATEQQRKSIAGVILGSKTKDGVEIKSIRDHAYNRMSERGYGASQVKGTYQLSDPKPGNRPNTSVYERGGLRVVVNYKTKELVTVVRTRGKGGKRERKT